MHGFLTDYMKLVVVASKSEMLSSTKENKMSKNGSGLYVLQNEVTFL